MGSVEIIVGDCREELRKLPDASVHCIVTSPPYFGLRDYGVDGQMGLEPTPDEFVAALVGVMREARRVLRDDGTLWLNLGDSYAGSWGAQGHRITESDDSSWHGSQIKNHPKKASRTGSVANIADCLTRALKGCVLLFGRPHPRCGAAESVHILIDDEVAPDGVFQPFLRSQRVTIKQGHDDLCEIGNTFDAPVTCWARCAPGATFPDYPDAERRMYLSENARIIIAAGDLYTDPALRSAVAGSVKNGKASFAVEVAGKPEAESVACEIAIRDAFALHTGPVGAPKVDAVYEPVALLDGANGCASAGGNLIVGKATGEHVAFSLHGGRELRVVSVGHLSLLKDGGVTPYRAELDKATKKANASQPKQELGIPEMVKRALMEDGWICRQTIIWHKPNPMPESVTDRCTKAHEYVFLLSKLPRYFYDSDAISEEAARPEGAGNITHKAQTAYEAGEVRLRTKAGLTEIGPRDRRNKRDVWSIPTQPFSEAHFATMAPELAETCIKAGCPLGGTVLDPFGGAGTTGLVADRLQRNAILIELNPEYAEIARRRIADDAPLLAVTA